jgi:hypothetical protein
MLAKRLNHWKQDGSGLRLQIFSDQMELQPGMTVDLRPVFPWLEKLTLSTLDFRHFGDFSVLPSHIAIDARKYRKLPSQTRSLFMSLSVNKVYNMQILSVLALDNTILILDSDVLKSCPKLQELRVYYRYEYLFQLRNIFLNLFEIILSGTAESPLRSILAKMEGPQYVFMSNANNLQKRWWTASQFFFYDVIRDFFKDFDTICSQCASRSFSIQNEEGDTFIHHTRSTDEHLLKFFHTIPPWKCNFTNVKFLPIRDRNSLCCRISFQIDFVKTPEKKPEKKPNHVSSWGSIWK